MRIPVVIVDDEEIDRMIALKRIARSEWADVLNPVIEAETGEVFLEKLIKCNALPKGDKLVLMDINMPGRNGFDTIDEMARLLTEEAAEGLVVMMFTSSENAGDVARAKALDLVGGYIVKPFDDTDIDAIVRVFGLRRPETAPDGTLLH